MHCKYKKRRGKIRIRGLEFVTVASTWTGKTKVGLEPGVITDVRKVPEDSQSQKASGWWAGLGPLGLWSCDLSPVLAVSGMAVVPSCPGALVCFGRGIERSKLSHADRRVP